MKYFTIDPSPVPALVKVSQFKTAGGVSEYHLMIRPTSPSSIETQMQWIDEAYKQVILELGLKGNPAVYRRFFCSDLVNQSPVLAKWSLSCPQQADEPCAVTWSGQPPVCKSKVALWAYLVDDPRGSLDKQQNGNSLILKRGELSHYWTTSLTHHDNPTPHDQTRDILQDYDAFLQGEGMTLADHVMRTWFVVQDIDVNYPDMVTARREFFTQHGLTPQTHFIASTGIGGTHGDLRTQISMDAYAICGILPEQIEYLSAPDYLSPTHVYGVTFERGDAIS